MSDVREQVQSGQETIAACAKAEFPKTLPGPRRAPLVVRGVQALRNRGLAYALRRSAEMAGLVAERPVPEVVKPKRKWPPRDDESLGLRAGERVTVKSAEEIGEMLDSDGRYKGLLFMSEMWKFCGKDFVVLQPIERIFSEATSQLHSGIRNTVLLDEVQCDGADHGECGARCYHMWREVWLRRTGVNA